MSHSALHQF